MSNTHRAKFSFRTLGGACTGQRWLYDHDEPIARFEHVTVDEPEQELRYFGGNPRPINLRYLKLRPGGRPLISGVQLFWSLIQGHLATSELIDLAIQGQDTDRLTMSVVTADPGGIATSHREMTLTYDNDLSSYVYDFDCHLRIHRPETFGGSAYHEFEFSDPWYVDLPAPSMAFEGMWQRRPYTHFLAELADGAIWKMPINHNVSRVLPHPGPMRRDGYFLPAFDAGHNVAFQFPGPMAEHSRIEVCHWGYDIHLISRHANEALTEPICARFRIVLCPDEKARALLDVSGPVPPLRYKGLAELPYYERKSSFARGVAMTEPTSEPGIDPFLWEPDAGCEEGAEWCRDFGRSDDCSLKIAKESAGPSRWIMEYEGEGSFMGHWTRSTGYRASCWIKTEDVQGAGSYLAMRWNKFHAPNTFPLMASQPLRGTNEWTQVKVELPAPAPADITDVAILLEQDGSGTTWFDDLEIEQLSASIGEARND